jgi:pantoate--beta-alanine ligase
MSSRNVRLSPEARQQATCLHRALQTAKTQFANGKRNAEQLRTAMLAEIAQASLAQVDYISIAHPDTLAELDTIEERALLSMAVFVDGIRLIDNMVVE